MNRSRVVVVVGVIMAMLSGAAYAQPVGTAFTYQGLLKQSGVPVNGAYHLRFQLFDAFTDGLQVGADVDHPALILADGLFAASLDFGSPAFDGSARWLQVQVLTNGGNKVTTLVPRQPISPAPYALYASNVDGPGVTGLNASNLASGTIDAARLPAGGNWPLTSALNIDSNTLAIDAVNNRIGIGTAAPLGPLHVAGNAAGLRLQDDDHPASYAVLEDASTGQLRLDKIAGLGGTLIDINPIPLDQTANANVRFFRHTNTTGSKSVIFHRGNDSTAASAVIGVDGGNSVFQLNGGNFGIGAALPAAPLHVQQTGPFMVLQDNASNANQAGYLGFWNSSGTETGWMGYGTPGSPHMTIFNGRAGGHINMLPNANVGIGTTAPLAKLDVRGDIRMGPTGSLRVTSSSESLRIVRGMINATGSIAHGSGFTVSHPSVGRYIITFSPAFFTTPTVTATGRTPVNARWDALMPGSVEILLFDGSGLVDFQFCFLAIGPP